MNLALADIRQWLEDMAALRKLTNVHIFNLLPALGMTGPDMDIDHALELWGTDAVHPTEEGYAALADSIKQFYNNIVVGARAEASKVASKAAAPKQKPAACPKPVHREGWVVGSDEVAKRYFSQQSYQGHAGLSPPCGGRTWYNPGPWGRGGDSGGTPARGGDRGGRSGSRATSGQESEVLAAATGGEGEGGTSPPSLPT
jgi:hypothetical protein